MASDVQCKKIGRNVELARVKNKKQNELLKSMGLGAMTDAYSTVLLRTRKKLLSKTCGLEKVFDWKIRRYKN